MQEYSFDNLNRGFSLNFFNILANNQIRMTIRKSNMKDNPDDLFSKIAPNVKTLFLTTPQQNPGSSEENRTLFNYSHPVRGSYEIEFKEENGYG